MSVNLTIDGILFLKELGDIKRNMIYSKKYYDDDKDAEYTFEQQSEEALKRYMNDYKLEEKED